VLVNSLSVVTELEGVMKKKDHEKEQLNERIRKLEQKQKESSVTFEFSLCNYLIPLFTYLLLPKDLSTNPSLDQTKAKALVDFI
jgi:hypothetical protein